MSAIFIRLEGRGEEKNKERPSDFPVLQISDPVSQLGSLYRRGTGTECCVSRIKMIPALSHQALVLARNFVYMALEFTC